MQRWSCLHKQVYNKPKGSLYLSDPRIFNLLCIVGLQAPETSNRNARGGQQPAVTGWDNAIRLGLTVPISKLNDVLCQHCVHDHLRFYTELHYAGRMSMMHGVLSQLTTAVAVPAPSDAQLRINVSTPNTMILKHTWIQLQI